MSKWRFYLLQIVISGGVGLLIYLLLQLLMALLVVNDVLADSRVMALQVVTGGVSALPSGILAVIVTKWIPATALTGAWLTLLTAVVGFFIYNEIQLDSSTLVRIGAMLIGGFLPLLLFTKKGRGHKGKKRSQHMRRI